jgi:hypothetical protein
MGDGVNKQANSPIAHASKLMNAASNDILLLTGLNRE